MLFKSDHLPINSCARKRENLHIVIVGNSNLLSREAHSNPCAFSCGLTKMSLSGWHYLLFSTSACLQPCQCRGNVSAVPSAVGWQQWRGVQDRQWPDRLRLAVRVLGRLMWLSDENTQGGLVGAQWWHWARGQRDRKQGTLPALQLLPPSALQKQVATVQQCTSNKHTSQYMSRYNSLCLFLGFCYFPFTSCPWCKWS